MFAFITMTSVFGALGLIAAVNSFFYVFDRRVCRAIHTYLVTRFARRIFAMLSTYMKFYFNGDGNLRADLPEQYLVISNHQSLLDIPFFMRFLGGSRLRFIAKAELGHHVPLVSKMLKTGGHCLVQRSGNPSQAMHAIDAFASRVKENNWIPVIFPEGTRSRDGSLGTFYAAGFRRFLDHAPMPVAVCALDGVWHISSIFGLAKNLRGGQYRVKILKIYPAPTTKAEQVHILEEGKELIGKQLAVWREGR